MYIQLIGNILYDKYILYWQYIWFNRVSIWNLFELLITCVYLTRSKLCFTGIRMFPRLVKFNFYKNKNSLYTHHMDFDNSAMEVRIIRMGIRSVVHQLRQQSIVLPHSVHLQYIFDQWNNNNGRCNNMII